MRIETQLSADNDIMHFFTESGFLEKGSIEFSDAQSLQPSPLAENICRVSGVVSVLITPDCLSVTKEHNALWDELKPQVLAEIADCLTESKVAETSRNPTPADIVCHIVGLLNARIRPTIRKDGGDIVFRGFENGVVYVELQGKCVGCPYSQRTLKEGVERLLRTYIKEVDTVEKYEN